LLDAARRIERHAGDVQDIEFTVESGRLWLLQSRAAKRSADAAVRIAVALAEEGAVSRDDALRLLGGEQVDALLRPRVEPQARADATVLVRGEPACPGVATGLVVTDCESAERLADTGADVVLARPFTDPDDVRGMIVSRAIVTEVGGATSHAAVLSRELGTPCVVGCGSGTLMSLAGRTVTVDGATGEIFDGALPMAPGGEHDNPALATLAAWARARVPGEPGSLRALIEAAQAATPAAVS
jgi:pyruvate,orthophosphate dikinase